MPPINRLANIEPRPRRPHSKPHLAASYTLPPWARTEPGEANTVSGLDVRNADDGSTVIRLYDEIGFWGVQASEFAEQMDGVTGDRMTLHLNSPGGDVFDGLAIYNTLRSHPSTVDVIVDGVAASAASFIAMAGDTVTMSPGSQMMIHDALGLVIGNASDMRRMVDLLDLQSDNIADLYMRRAGGTRDDWRALMQAETWYLADDAVAAGLADSVIEDAARQPSDRLRMAWHEWIRAYAGREQPHTPAADPKPAPDPQPVGAFPADLLVNQLKAFRQGRH